MSTLSEVTRKIDAYTRARYPLVAVVTHEEERAVKMIESVVGERPDLPAAWEPRQVVTWSINRGVQGLRDVSPDATLDPIAALQELARYALTTRQPLAVVFFDFHHYLENPMIVRALRELAALFADETAHTAYFVGPAFTVPADLEKTVVLVDLPLPCEAELAEILATVERRLSANGIPVTLNGSRPELVRALRGLTAFEAHSVLLNAVVSQKGLNDECVPLVVKEKAQIVRKSGVLEFYDTTETVSNVGGLVYLKAAAAQNLATLEEGAREFGVDPSKGMLLVGVPGAGKSLLAKAIAGGRLPLLRLDIGALFGGIVGESEGNLRRALKTAEAVAPCILWIDEVEKGLSSQGGELDGGTSTRVFGSLLTWMQESDRDVFVIATANDVRSLRPEFLRRFSEIFWVDLPNAGDRREILEIHLRKRSRDPEKYVLETIVERTRGFTGAEIEKVVQGALKAAYFAKRQDVTNRDLLEAAGNVVPISTTMKEDIEELRIWARGRARPASEPFEADETRKPEKAGAGALVV